MKKFLFLTVLGAICVLGSDVEAYAQDEDTSECECRDARVRVFPYPDPGEWRGSGFVVGGRARLGVMVRTDADAETDGVGAYIERVVEGGPAAKAGMRSGDIITRLDGASLLSGSETYDADRSAPGMRLIERARELERGDTVDVEFERDGSKQTVNIVAGEFDEDVFIGSIDDRVRVLVDRLQDLPRVEFRGPDIEYVGPESFAFHVGAGLPGLQLVSLNPDLGDYFGVREGVLVLSVPDEGELGLKAGDVILKIGGRDVQSPSHAMRILRSYDPEEEIALQVRRKNRTQTVTGKVPSRMRTRSFEMRRHRN